MVPGAEFDECKPIVSDEATFRRVLTSANFAPDATFRGTIRRNSQMPGLLGLSGTEHRAHRQKVAMPFAPHSIERLSNGFAQIARKHLPVPSEDTLVVGRDFARPMALDCVMNFVGLDPSKSERVAQLSNEFFRCDPAPSPTRRAILALRLSRLVRQQGSQSAVSKSLEVSGLIAPLHSTIEDAGEDGIAVALTTLFGNELIVRGILGCLWLSVNESPNLEAVDRSIIDRSIVESRLMYEVYRERISGCAIGNENLEDGMRVSLCPTSTEPRNEEVPHYMPFGYGPHYCLAANLVRSIVTEACNTFLKHFSPTGIAFLRREEGTLGRPGGVIELHLSVKSRSNRTGT